MVTAVHRLREASSFWSTLNLTKSRSAIAVARSSSSSCHFTESHSVTMALAYLTRSPLYSGSRSMRSVTPFALSTEPWISSFTR